MAQEVEGDSLGEVRACRRPPARQLPPLCQPQDWRLRRPARSPRAPRAAETRPPRRTRARHALGAVACCADPRAWRYGALIRATLNLTRTHALSLPQEFKGYVFKIMGGQDKEGFPMKQGVLTNGRVRLLMHRGDPCFRGYGRRNGERRRKSVRGCIVSQDLATMNLVIVKQARCESAALSLRSRECGALTRPSASVVCRATTRCRV